MRKRCFFENAGKVAQNSLFVVLEISEGPWQHKGAPKGALHMQLSGPWAPKGDFEKNYMRLAPPMAVNPERYEKEEKN